MLYLSFILVNFIILKNINKLATRLNLIDFSKNKLHSKDTPKFGFFMSITILIFLIIYSIKLNLSFIYLKEFFFILSFCLLGFFDDTKNFSVKSRFYFALIICLIFYYDTDYFVSINFPIYINIFFLIFFTLGFLHLVNITDGVNGYILSLFIFSMIYFFFKSNYFEIIFYNQLIILSFLASSIFIVPNFLGYTFLGNSGSYALSIIITIIYVKLFSLKLVEYSDILNLFIFPLCDGLRTSLSRVLNGSSPFKGDFNHIHHKIREKKLLLNFYIVLSMIPGILNFLYKDYSIYILLNSIFIYLIFYNYIKKNILRSKYD